MNDTDKTKEQLTEALAEAEARIAGHKQVEEALWESEKRFRAIAETASDAIIILDNNENIFYWNRAAQDIFGYMAGETRGTLLSSIMPEQFCQVFREEMKRAITIGESDFIGTPIETVGVRKDGSEFPLELSLATWSSKDQALFTAIARDITKRRQAEDALRQRNIQLESLRQVGLELAAQLNLDTLLHFIVSQAVELLEAASGGLYLYQPERDLLEWCVAVGLDVASIGTTLHRGEGLSGKVWESGEPQFIDNYQEWEGKASTWKDFPAAAVVGAPVRWGEEFLGVLNVRADAPRRFFPSDAELLSLFTSQAAVAIRNARLYEEAQRRAERLALVNRIAKAAGATLHLDELAKTVYEEIVPVFQADAFFIALYDEATNELEFPIWVDEGANALPKRVPLGNGFTSLVVSRKKPLIVRDFEQEQDHLPPQLLVGAMKPTLSWLGAPMLIGEGVIGVVSVQAYRPHAWDKEDEQLLFTITDQLAVAIENARLYEAVQQELAERKRAEEALQEAYENVERLVEERTAELKQEMAERKRLEVEQERLKQEIIQAQRRALL